MILQKTGLLLVLLSVCVLLIAAGCTQPDDQAVPGQAGAVAAQTAAAVQEHVRLETTMGNITIVLDPDMPVTVGNFLNLTKSGFYDNVTFHRVIAGYIIQAGDPTGTGRGGPGYTIPDEFSGHNHNLRGTVAMANTGRPDTGSSQFFINLVDNTRLDNRFPVFGTVTDGMNVVDAIANVTTDEDDRPLTNVTILRAEVV